MVIPRFQKFHGLLVAIILGIGILCYPCVVKASVPVQDNAYFSYHFVDPGYTNVADSILNKTRHRLQKLLKNNLEFHSDIYMVATQAQFDSLVGGKFPEWGAAAAIPFNRRMVIKSPDRFNVNKSLEELLAHEYAHLALSHRTGWREPPRWFNEGLAILVSMEWSWSNNLTMSLSSIAGRFIPLQEIERVNTMGGSNANLAYAEAYLAVQYLYDAYGNDAVNIFLDAIAAGGSYDIALMSSIGSDYADFEGEFRLYLDKRYNLVSLLADMMYFWLGLAVLLIVGAILTMRRKRRYLDQWDEEEKLASTDFDYGDPDHPESLDDDDEAWRR